MVSQAQRHKMIVFVPIVDRRAMHALNLKGDCHVEWFEGNFADYEEDKKKRLGDQAVEPHRIKFKRFER